MNEKTLLPFYSYNVFFFLEIVRFGFWCLNLTILTDIIAFFFLNSYLLRRRI